MMATSRSFKTLLLAAALAASASGCGRRFTEPVQRLKPPFIPPPATFILVASWTQPGWQPSSVLMTHSGILLVAEDSARVRNYSSLGEHGQPVPVDIYRFNGLVKPVHIAEGNSHVFVADMGDGSPANPIRVFEFDPSQGLNAPMDAVSTLQDPSWVTIRGVASDAQRNLYVSCDARVLVSQPPNPDEVDTQTVVYRYRPPYSPAVRDTVAEQGTGTGTMQNAHEICYSDGKLYVTDTGKDWVQKLDATRKNFGLFKVDGTEADSAATPMRGPQGVAADGQGYFYVADTGNRRVLRYTVDGAFDQVVNQVGPDGMLAPVSVSAGTVQSSLYLYVADPTAHIINVYRFQR